MKSLGLGLIVLSLLLAVAPAGAQDAGKTSFTINGHAEGGQFYFSDESGAKNPTLVVPANTDITITLKNVGDGVHNVCFADKCSEFIQADGETTTFTFNSGANGGQYFCQPHKGSGMAGNVQIAGQATTTTTTGGSNGGGNDSPGLGVLGAIAALAGAVLLLRRK